MRRLGLSLLAVLASACSDDPPAAPRDIPALAERPTVELRGCIHREGSRCILEAGRKGTAPVWLWVDVEASAELGVELDGAPHRFDPHPADGGLHLALRLPEGAGSLQLTGVEPTWPAPFALELGWQRASPVVAEARALGRQGKGKAAIALLESSLPSLDPPQRLAALQRLRKLIYPVDPAKSLRYAEQAAELARAQGRDRDLAELAASLAHGSTETRSWDRARRWLDEAARLGELEPESRVWVSHAQGVLAKATGDLTEALRHLTDAERGAERLGMIDSQLAALQGRAVVLGELGRAREALAVVHRGMVLADTPNLRCETRTRLLGNLGWAKLRLVQQGFDADVPWEAFERALEDAEHRCPSPVDAVNLRVNLALAALVSGELDDAADRHQQLVAQGVPRWLQPWVDEIGARLATAQGRMDRAPSLLLEPAPSGQLGLDWSVVVRRADALAELGLIDAAIDAYTRAEHMLDDAVATVGIGVGREMFLSSRAASVHGLMRQLVTRGNAAEAACRVRLARGRALRTVDRAARIAGLSPSDRARWEQVSTRVLQTRAELSRQASEDWSLSETQRALEQRRRAERHRDATAALDEALRTLLAEPTRQGCEQLPAWSSDERLLLLTDDGEGLVIFVGAADGSITVTSAEPGAEPEAGVGRALGAQSEQLHGAARIRVMTEGLARDLRLPRVPLADGTLLDLGPMVHALDLSDGPRREPGPRRALVIADPSEDLPEARQEAEAVERALAGAGWDVQRQQGKGATREAVIDALGRATLLHYAGHGTHRGGGGWDSALLLHEGELGVIDLLAIPRVPAAVVLAGCDTGSRGRSIRAGDINLGRAFVLAGADQVLVADQTLDDRLARRAGEDLARELASQPNPDLAAALWEVQRELRAELPDAPWWRLRVLVP